jgi:hypothetical protein
MKQTLIFTMVICFGLSCLLFSQSRETGAILGRVVDDQGNPLPGAAVSLTGESLMGSREYIADAHGAFRFPALPPGEYALKAEMAGFKTVVQKDIRLATTVSLTIDLVMELAAVAEEVTVRAKSPTVDIKSTETASVTLPNEMLRNIPYSQTSWDIVDLAPGVKDGVAHGASAETGIAWSVDGVNVSDPEAGAAWVLLDHNIIGEAKVMGAGLPAEYGNFTGAVFNLVTKSGGNIFSGHFESDFKGQEKDKPSKFWQAQNTGAYVHDFPELTSPRERMLDISGHLGGPVKRDKLWFYAGAQWAEVWSYPTGFPLPADILQPRGFAKLTSQLSSSLSLIGWLEFDIFNIENSGGNAYTSPEATATNQSPEIVANLSLTKILSPNTFFDLKGAFFGGYVKRVPKAGMEAVSRREITNGYYKTGSFGIFYRADRSRLQFNASLTHYAEDFIRGSHDFKFGVEVERSSSRNRAGYTGANHIVYWDYQGMNYVAYQYEGYDTKTGYTRLEGFVQDSWQVIPRLNINAGLRLSQNWGTVKDTDGAVYKTTRLAPRLGFVFDIFGDKKTILKAHYGQFTEAMLTAYHDRLNPASAYHDLISLYWDGMQWVEFDRLIHEELYKFDPKIRHPYVNQITVGLERELFKDASFSISYIYREWKNIISYYDRKSDYSQISLFVPELGRTYEIYERISGSAHEYILANIKQGDPWVLGKPYRKYWGVELLFNKRFSNRWQLLASYVYSKAWGTMDNTFASDIGYNWGAGLFPSDPNFWLNADGRSTYDPTHVVKVQGTYVIPWADVSMSFYFRAISGYPWTTRCRTERLAQGLVTFFAEPRGSHGYDMQKILDVRLEKIFTLGGKYRLGLIADVFNVFNANTITSWGTLVNSDYFLTPETNPSADGHAIQSILTPRQARLGIRFIF